MLLKPDRTGSLNQVRTSIGAFFTLLPTRGSARTMNACALACAAIASKLNNLIAIEMSCFRFIVSFPTKQRSAQRMRKQIVEIEMHLANYAHRFPSSLIDWYDRFHPELYVLARPDHAGINRASGLTAPSAIQRRVKGKLYKRDEPVERSAQSNILYLFLQIDERVFQREAISQHVWMALNFHVAGSRAGARWDGNADHTRRRNGPQ